MRFLALLNFLFGAGAMVAYPLPAIKTADPAVSAFTSCRGVPEIERRL
jgi:uncharacterized membrane protein YeiB